MEVLTQQGWRMFYHCMCGGTRREHYSNVKFIGYEIRVRPSRPTFSILKDNRIIAGPKFLYQLEETLKEKEIYQN